MTVRREKARIFSGCKSRPGTGSLHPVAPGAVVEVTKRLKPAGQRVARRPGERAGRKVSERRAGLETDNAGADLSVIQTALAAAPPTLASAESAPEVAPLWGASCGFPGKVRYLSTPLGGIKPSDATCRKAKETLALAGVSFAWPAVIFVNRATAGYISHVPWPDGLPLPGRGGRLDATRAN